MKSNIIPLYSDKMQEIVSFRKFTTPASCRVSNLKGFLGLPFVQYIRYDNVTAMPNVVRPNEHEVTTTCHTITQALSQRLARLVPPFSIQEDHHGSDPYGLYGISFALFADVPVPYQIWDFTERMVITNPDDVARMIGISASKLHAAIAAKFDDIPFGINGLQNNDAVSLYLKTKHEMSDSMSYTMYINDPEPMGLLLAGMGNIIL